MKILFFSGSTLGDLEAVNAKEQTIALQGKNGYKVAYSIGIVILCLALSAIATATPIDLSSWSVNQYAFHVGYPPGNWVLSDNNETVTQTLNADPSMYLNGINQTSYQMDGSWRVVSGDDDFMGFVFGYQDASHFYLMDWKQGDQDVGAYFAGESGIGREGFAIKKVSADSVSDLSGADFWLSSGTENTTVLASDFGTGKGWEEDTLYNFHLDFEPGTFSIVVKQDDIVLCDVTVNDSAYSSGQFGFYNFSQSMVEYSGFEQTGGKVVPEPGSLVLVGLGLAGIGLWRKFRT